jgi:hypothetical protein
VDSCDYRVHSVFRIGLHGSWPGPAAPACGEGLPPQADPAWPALCGHAGSGAGLAGSAGDAKKTPRGQGRHGRSPGRTQTPRSDRPCRPQASRKPRNLLDWLDAPSVAHFCAIMRHFCAIMRRLAGRELVLQRVSLSTTGGAANASRPGGTRGWRTFGLRRARESRRPSNPARPSAIFQFNRS